jgi:hypothetical protein
MPVCRECAGTGQKIRKKEIMKHCPTCQGTKRLPNGAECERCNQWGEVGTGEFEVDKQLCNTCWGSGKVSEGSVTVWFLLRAVPATLVLLGGGGAAIWATWVFSGNPLATSIVSVVVFGVWGGLMAYFIGQMPTLGEISTTNWFLIRAIPTTLVALELGGAILWSSWVYLVSPPVTALLAVAIFALWGVLMYYFISHLPE